MSIIKCAGCSKPVRSRHLVRLVVELAEKDTADGWEEGIDQAKTIREWTVVPFGAFHLECAQRIVDQNEPVYYQRELSELPLDESLEELSRPKLHLVQKGGR